MTRAQSIMTLLAVAFITVGFCFYTFVIRAPYSAEAAEKVTVAQYKASTVHFPGSKFHIEGQLLETGDEVIVDWAEPRMHIDGRQYRYLVLGDGADEVVLWYDPASMRDPPIGKKLAVTGIVRAFPDTTGTVAEGIVWSIQVRD